MSSNRLLRRFVSVAGLALVASAAALTQGTVQPVPPPGEEVLVEDIVAWVNDDIVRLSQLVESEQAVIARLLREGNASADQIEAQLDELRQTMMLQSIWDRLLVQQAERLFDVEGIKQDLIDQFMQRNQLESVQELDRLLDQELGMTRGELADRLFVDVAPRYVVDSLVMPRLGVSEAQAREYYEENIDRFTTPASVSFREIVLLVNDSAEWESARVRADEIGETARSGVDFVELVREKSEAPSRAIDGKIGPVDPRDLIDEVAAAVMSLEPGAVSDPIRTDQGWHVLVVEDRQDAEVEPFEQVRDVCEDAIRSSKIEGEYEKFVAELWEQSTIEVREPYLSRLPSPWDERVTVRN
jgi:parvulin-like peptidyl-prolyl isomerase